MSPSDRSFGFRMASGILLVRQAVPPIARHAEWPTAIHRVSRNFPRRGHLGGGLYIVVAANCGAYYGLWQYDQLNSKLIPVTVRRREWLISPMTVQLPMHRKRCVAEDYPASTGWGPNSPMAIPSSNSSTDAAKSWLAVRSAATMTSGGWSPPSIHHTRWCTPGSKDQALT